MDGLEHLAEGGIAVELDGLEAKVPGNHLEGGTHAAGNGYLLGTHGLGANPRRNGRGAGAEDEDIACGRYVALKARLAPQGKRLGQGSLLHADGRMQAVTEVSRMQLEGTQKAIVYQTGTHVVKTLFAEVADAAGKRGLHDHTIAHVKVMDTATYFLHESRGIVTQRHSLYVTVAVFIDMDV